MHKLLVVLVSYVVGFMRIVRRIRREETGADPRNQYEDKQGREASAIQLWLWVIYMYVNARDWIMQTCIEQSCLYEGLRSHNAPIQTTSFLVMCSFIQLYNQIYYSNMRERKAKFN